MTKQKKLEEIFEKYTTRHIVGNKALYVKVWKEDVPQFKKEIIELFEPQITYDKSALKFMCETFKVPYNKNIVGFTKYGVIVTPESVDLL